MKIVLFYHSLVSDWNHGNAHFLRGVATELQSRGHKVVVYEPADSWSVTNLISDEGQEAIERFHEAYPELRNRAYSLDDLALEQVLDDADVVIVHEWNEHELVSRIGAVRARGGRFTLLFHDTHHRAVSEPEEMILYDLRHYDGVLVFGQALEEIYRDRDWAQNVWTWHEAADTRRFIPLPGIERERDVVWVGNWGDDERADELREFLFEPVRSLALQATIHGVRYPAAALRELARAGIEYRGWVANFEVPSVFARHKVTVHVPRRPYTRLLPGIPTIRPFEAMACGIPLISAPWDDTEGLFAPGEDFLVARDGEEMKRHLSKLLRDADFAGALAARALATILDRHTCAHRVDQLFEIIGELQRPLSRGVAVGER